MLTLTARNIANYWKKVSRAGPDDCWTWIGGKNSDGYGAFGVGGKQRVATHVALTLDGRPRPSVAHHALHGDCTNPACVNPAHLRWGTQQENVDDKLRLGRLNHYRGESSPNAKLCEDAVATIRASSLSGRTIAKIHGVSPATVSLIRSRKIWAHLP